jgi:hypothetical protein
MKLRLIRLFQFFHYGGKDGGSYPFQILKLTVLTDLAIMIRHVCIDSLYVLRSLDSFQDPDGSHMLECV